MLLRKLSAVWEMLLVGFHLNEENTKFVTVNCNEEAIIKARVGDTIECVTGF